MRRFNRSVFVIPLFFVLSLVCGLASALRPVDYGDVWYNPNEGGWGMQIADQGDVLFLTFYVYGTDGKPTWFTSLVTFSSTTPAGARVYTGGLYVNTGPYYGVPFNPAAVTTRLAGNATFQADTSTTATLTYIVDGVQVVKSIQRYAYSPMNLSGTGYIGSFIEFDTGCNDPLKNGPVALNGTFTISHNPPAPQVIVAVTLTDGVNTLACTFQGTFSQAGRYGAINAGTFICPANGDNGTFAAHDIELTSQGILARYDNVSAKNGCHGTGGFGGLLPN